MDLLMVPIFVLCGMAIILAGLSNLKDNEDKAYLKKSKILFFMALVLLLSSSSYKKYLDRTLMSKMYLENKSYGSMTKDERIVAFNYHLHFNNMIEEELKIAIPVYIHYTVQWRMDYLVKPYDQAVKEVKEELDLRKIDYSLYMKAFEINKK